MSGIRNHIRGKYISVKGVWFTVLVTATIILGMYANIFSYVAFAIAIMAIFVLSDDESLCFLTFIMSFASIFKSAPTAASFFTYLMAAYTVCALFRSKRINWLFWTNFLFLALFIALQMFMNSDLLRTLKFLVHVVFIYTAMDLKMTEGHEKVFLFYILGVIISSLIAAMDILPNLQSYVEVKELDIKYGEGTRFTGLYADPNYYTVNVIISLCLVLVLNYKGRLSALAACVFGVLLVTFAILTYSKSAFLMLILPAFMLLYSKVKSKNLLAFLLLLMVLGILMIGVVTGQIEAVEIVLRRFGSGDDVNAMTTNRFSIWGNYLEHLGKFGFGTFVGEGFGATLLDEYAAHNTYLDMLYYLGIVGTVLFCNVLAAAHKCKETPKVRSLLNYSVWISVLALYFFLSELFYFDWSFHVLMAMLTSKTEMQQPIHLRPVMFMRQNHAINTFARQKYGKEARKNETAE